MVAKFSCRVLVYYSTISLELVVVSVCLNARCMNQRRMRVWHSSGLYAANQDLQDS